jgi:catechol 2,3-dioxygenase-like lactoylglutathione lyase family enzyme
MPWFKDRHPYLPRILGGAICGFALLAPPAAAQTPVSEPRHVTIPQVAPRPDDVGTIDAIVRASYETALAAQAPMSDTSSVLSVRGAMLAFVVPDLDSSAKWYTDKLDLKIVHWYPRTRGVHARAALLQGGGLAVELVQEGDAVEPGPQHRRGLQKAGLVLNDFDRAVATLRARGVEFASVYPRRPDQPANVTIRDNAGNLIVLHEGFSSFNDPLIGLVQVDPLEERADGTASPVQDTASKQTPGCSHGIVIRDSLEPGGTVVSNRGLSGITVTAYTTSPSSLPIGAPLASARSDASGAWHLPPGVGGSAIITFVPPPRSAYHGAFTLCDTWGSQSLLVVLPHR